MKVEQDAPIDALKCAAALAVNGVCRRQHRNGLWLT